MTEKQLDIIEFTKNVLNKHIFDYEEKILRNYEEFRSWSTYDEWVRPQKRENQYIYNIWMCYKEYLNGTLDLNVMKISNLVVK